MLPIPTGSKPLPSTSDASQQLADEELRTHMQQVRWKLVVLSGKGGVGKSTIAANLAVVLAGQGCKVGLLDVDVHGPSIPRLMGMEEAVVRTEDACLLPVQARERLWVMSIGFLLHSKEDAVIWRGPLKSHLIREFLSNVAWGALDYLIIDSPPGTGDEPLSVAQLVGRPAAAIVVTTPQQLAISDVRRCVTFCQQVSLPVAGMLENMSGFVCPNCGARVDLFGSGGGKRLAEEMGVRFLGEIPIDPAIVTCSDHGLAFVDRGSNASVTAFVDVVRRIRQSTGQGVEVSPVTDNLMNIKM